MATLADLDVRTAAGASAAPVTFARGDGVGPEIMEATLHILEAAGARLALEEIEIGERVYERGGKFMYLGANGYSCDVEFPDESRMRCLTQMYKEDGSGYLVDPTNPECFESRMEMVYRPEGALLGFLGDRQFAELERSLTHVVAVREREATSDRDGVPVEQLHVGTQVLQVARELERDATRRVARHHDNVVLGVGQQRDRSVVRTAVDGPQRRLDVVRLELERAVEGGTARVAVTYPFHCGAQPRGELLAHRTLEVGEALEPELGAHAHHGCRARACFSGKRRNGSEGDVLRLLAHDIGHALLGGGERRFNRPDARGDVHDRTGS